MKQMLAGFAAHGESAGNVRAGSEAALHGVADGFVFVLHFFADLDARLIFSLSLFADVREVVVKYHRALVHAQGQNEIGVHHAFIGVDHEFPRNSRSGAARPSRLTKTKFSQVSTLTGTRPFFARSKLQTPSNSTMPLSAPSLP